MLKEEIENSKISEICFFLKKWGILKSLDDLKELTKEANVNLNLKHLLQYIPEANLEYIVDLYSIKSIDGLIVVAKIIDENPELKYLLRDIPEANFKYIVDIYSIKSIDDLIKLSEIIDKITDKKDKQKDLIMREKMVIEINNLEKEIKSGDFNKETINEKVPYLIFHPICTEIKEKFLKILEKSPMGGYQAKTFPINVLNYICSNLTLHYLALKKSKGKFLGELRIKQKSEKGRFI